VLSPAAVRRLAKRLDSLLRAEHGDDVAGRFIALEQPWLHDEVMRLVAFSPRLAGPAAELLGEPAIRIYHDNALSKEPGCGRTPWHHDAEHFPLATLQAVTAWIPVTAIPAYMGPLALARGAQSSIRFGCTHYRRKRRWLTRPGQFEAQADPNLSAAARTHGDARSTQRRMSSRNTRPARPVRGCPWNSRRCTPTVLAAGRRPLYVRGHRDTPVHSATR
jgi:hypothetical protein